MLAEVSLSWSKARADLSSVRPNHSYNSRPLRTSSSNRGSNNNHEPLDPGHPNMRHPLAQQPLVLYAHNLSCPISLGTSIARALHHLPRSSRNNPAMLLRPALRLPVVLVQHQPQVAQGLQRPPQAMDDRQPRLRRAIPYCATEKRSSIRRTTCVRNVRFFTPSLTCCSPMLCPRTRKGQNTGYKNFDPTHPCRKCWDRFSKLFTSILASSPWGGQGSGPTSQTERGRSFQRPLPAFKPPQAQPRPPQPMPGGYPAVTRSPLVTQGPPVRVVPMPDGNVPPIGATVVMPGDPRIGGRVCWRCGGRGVTPFLIFDEETCDTCGGIGRLMN